MLLGKYLVAGDWDTDETTFASQSTFSPRPKFESEPGFPVFSRSTA